MYHSKRDKKHRRKDILLPIAIVAVFVLSITFFNVSVAGIKNLAGVFFVDSITAEELRQDFTVAKKSNGGINILIVPGHDDGIGGTEFGELKERELNIKVAEELTRLLRQKKEFRVHLTRNAEEYNPDIQAYLEKNRDNIDTFQRTSKKTMGDLVASGLIDLRNDVEHNSAPSETALRLYGINKWANENDIDIVIHIHFNDHPGRKYNQPGEYSGLAIYVPERQFSNAKASKALAETVFRRLTAYTASSDMPQELTGIIEDQELIAIGAYNTLDPAVLLIEYGYIYESQFTSHDVRELAVKDRALQTYLGILDFFSTTDLARASTYNTATLPYLWDTDLKKGTRGDADIYALQTALAFDLLYPQPPNTKNDCPVNGNFGPCTERAVIAFQKRYEIEPASGYIGPLTRAKLNELYSAR